MRTITIGRNPENQIIISDSRVSGKHATLTIMDNGVLVLQDHSTNGTYVNGVHIQHQSKEIHRGDQIMFPGNLYLDWNRVPQVQVEATQRVYHTPEPQQPPVREAQQPSEHIDIKPNEHMGWSVLSMVLGAIGMLGGIILTMNGGTMGIATIVLFVLGILAVVYSSNSKKAWDNHKVQEAKYYATKAKKMNVSFLIVFIICVLLIIFLTMEGMYY